MSLFPKYSFDEESLKTVHREAIIFSYNLGSTSYAVDILLFNLFEPRTRTHATASTSRILRDRDEGFKIKLDDVLKHVLSQL